MLNHYLFHIHIHFYYCFKKGTKKIEIESTPEVIHAKEEKNEKKGTRNKWTEVEQIWLQWLVLSIRLKKYVLHFDKVNDINFHNLETRISWNIIHQMFHHFPSIVQCFTSYDDNMDNFIDSNIIHNIHERTEYAIKQHWRILIFPIIDLVMY